MRQVGSALGTAFAGVALSISLATSLPAALDDAGVTSPAATQVADSTRESAGTTIGVLRAQGEGSPLGDQTAVGVDALADGFATATRSALVLSAGFLVLGFIGAIRVRRSAEAPADHPG